MENFGLKQSHLKLLHDCFAPYAELISIVSVFGSRATRAFKPYSDLDIVVYGKIQQRKLNLIVSQLLEGSFPYQIDFIAYESISEPLLLQHINNYSKPLFTQAELSIPFEQLKFSMTPIASA